MFTANLDCTLISQERRDPCVTFPVICNDLSIPGWTRPSEACPVMCKDLVSQNGLDPVKPVL